MFPYRMIAQQGERQYKLNKQKDDAAKKLERIQKNCDHDWENISNGKFQCTYPECQKIEESE